MHGGAPGRAGSAARQRLCEIEASLVRRFCGKIGARQADTGWERIGGRCAAFTGQSHSKRGRRCISTEVELKLTAPAVYLPELQRRLAEMAPEAASLRRRLISTYYDAPDLALKSRGLTLRVREQEGRFIQTVKKGDLATDGDLLRRGEWEDELVENRPDPHASHSGSHLPDGVAGNLQPLFATDVTRTTVAIEPLPATRIEAATDEGEIRTAGGSGTEPISEIELELSCGDAAALYDVAMQLLEVAPIRIEPRSKSERGYQLGEGKAATPPVVHAEPLILDRAMSVEAALQEIGRACLAHLLRNEAAALATQPEGVHQMRVAERRIRSAIAAFKKLIPAAERRWISGELRYLVDILGSARNLDVFATELLQPTRAALADAAGLDELAAELDGARREAYARVEHAIVSERHAAGMLRLSHWFEARAWRAEPGEPSAELASPMADVAPRLLARRWREVRRRGRRFSRQTPRQRHKLRIAAKKLRYTIELLESLFDPDDVKRFVRRLKRLQDDLGYANDVRAARDLLPDLAKEAAAWRAGIRVLEWHEDRLSKGERKLRKRLKRLNRAAPFWRRRQRAGD
jgi:triphosphatase